MLIATPKYDLTMEEIAQVCAVRLTTIYAAVFLCPACQGVKMVVSRDCGLTRKWIPAANVLHRLHRGHVICGDLK
jgi:hypothetical protein